jgi:hypothetical protein
MVKGFTMLRSEKVSDERKVKVGEKVKDNVDLSLDDSKLSSKFPRAMIKCLID